MHERHDAEVTLATDTARAASDTAVPDATSTPDTAVPDATNTTSATTPFPAEVATEAFPDGTAAPWHALQRHVPC